MTGSAPTDAEQYMLELINRARANPAVEGQRLLALAATNPLIHQATQGENLNLFYQEISSYAPEPPLAFNPRLIDAALAEDASMLAKNAQQHSAPGFLNSPNVAVDTDGQAYFPTGSGWWSTGENIFAFSSGVTPTSTTSYMDYFEAGFLLDWGNPDFGHLKNLLAPGPAEANTAAGVFPYNQVGIGLLAGSPTTLSSTGVNVGPELVTQEFGWRQGNAFLTGTFYNDLAGTQFYQPGEGLGGVTIIAVGTAGQGTFQAQTWTSGGYSLQLPPGTYHVTATGANLPGTQAKTVTIGLDNMEWEIGFTGQTVKTSAGIPVPADYDGVGHAEYATYQSSTGIWTIDNPTTGPYMVTFGLPGDIPVPGHYDGGSKTELAVYRPSNSTWYILGPTGARAVPFGGLGDVPVPGDYDGDGKTDLAVYSPANGVWSIARSASHTIETVAFGFPGLDEPVPATYDGGGVTEIAVLRPSTYQWFIIGPTAIRNVSFGFPGCIPIPAPYEGGGRADLALFNPTTATFYDWNTLLVGRYGAPNLDQPAPADYEVDGKADLSVFRPTTAQWFVLNSRVGTTETQIGHGGTSQTLMSLATTTISVPIFWVPWVEAPSAEEAGGFGPLPDGVLARNSWYRTIGGSDPDNHDA
jgi:FG-GAP repeat